MPIGINNQPPPFGAKRSGQSSIQDNFRKLSSGKRINRASDDAAGLAISENLSAQIRSLEAATRNTSRGLSIARTAEGGASQISDVTIRLRELAVQAADGALSEGDREAINVEAQQLLEEINRTSESTEFNEQELLSGPEQSLELQVGAGTSPEDRVAITTGGISTTSLGLDGLTLAGADSSNAQAAIGAIDQALSAVNERRATFGAQSNRLSRAAENLTTQRNNLAESNSRIRDADYARETANLAGNQVRQRAQVAIRAQANAQNSLALNLLQ